MRFDRYAGVAAVLLITAALLPGQIKPSKSVTGTVTGFKVDAHTSAVLVKSANRSISAIPFSPDTEVVRAEPGAHDLSKVQPARMTDIVTGDRVLVSFVEGMTEARRIVLVTATDIAKRNEASRLAWQTNGVAGVVASTNGNQIALRRAQQVVTVTTDEHTIIRRYAPDSVRFTDAAFSSVSQIAAGDQLQARGEKSNDGLTLKTQEIVFEPSSPKPGQSRRWTRRQTASQSASWPRISH